MLAIQQISGPLGVVLGYIVTVVAKKFGPVYAINFSLKFYEILINNRLLISII